ncbi:MAG: hypothetical protein J6I49_03880 [Bacteroidales bacterium]|nr:hypothetical protein [Bacteroidales bacterium]
MVPYFPKIIANKGMYLYLGALAAVSLVFIRHSMGIEFILIGIMWVVGFFKFSSMASQKWKDIPARTFTRNIFLTALALRIAWAIFSYHFFIAKTGQPFEFEAADALLYYWWGVGFQHTSLSDMWKALFIDVAAVSDSGYAFFLGLVNKVTGPSILIQRFVLGTLSAFTCVLLYHLAKRNVGEEAGRMASVFACFFPNLIYYCGLHMKETYMIFIIVAFLERTDYLIRNKKHMWLNLALSILTVAIMFTLRTVLGAVAIFSVASGLIFTNAKIIGKIRRYVLIGWAVLAATTLAGGVIMTEIEETWEDRDNNQEQKRTMQVNKGVEWAQYATTTVMAPMIFVLPFPTMVDVDRQYNQQIISGGNFVRNFLGGFVLVALFSALFVTKNWRNLSLIGSFVVAYLGIIASSGYANAERFLLPGVPVLLIMAAYGVSILNAKYYRFIKIWYYVVPILAFAWAFFKLGSRGIF